MKSPAPCSLNHGGGGGWAVFFSSPLRACEVCVCQEVRGRGQACITYGSGCGQASGE